jgi:enoyl-CoA hydratase/carnithine racemase
VALQRHLTVSSTIAGSVVTILLERPDVLNCANQELVDDLHAVLDEIAANPRVRVVVVRGAGRAFCSGIDLSALARGDIDRRFFRGWEEALRRVETLEPLVIAAVQSHCIGGGLQLALACDFRIARADARFGVTAVKEGIIPGMGMWRIARYAGLGRAKRLALAAEVVDANTALEWGLVDRVADVDRFEPAIEDLTQHLLSMAWTSTRLTKKLIAQSVDASFADLLETFCEYQATATSSREHLDAMAEYRRERERRATHA